MSTESKYSQYARALRADVHAAAPDTLPRREVLLAWLDSFLLRAELKGYHADGEEVENLTAIATFTRDYLNLNPTASRVYLH